MRIFSCLFTLIIFTLPAQAQVKCLNKAQALIVSTAKAMGQKGEFAVHLSAIDAGHDSDGNPIVNFSSGPFIVDDGYVSGSNSSVDMRSNDPSCTAIKLNVSIGK